VTTRKWPSPEPCSVLVHPSILIRHSLRAGFTIEEIFSLTKIDRWFLVQIKEIVDFEEELAEAKN
jgi:hypothetical protein